MLSSPANIIAIIEEQSGDVACAAELFDYSETKLKGKWWKVPATAFYDGQSYDYSVPVINAVIAVKDTEKYVAEGGGISLRNFPRALCDIRELPDGRRCIMLTDELWKQLDLPKKSRTSIDRENCATKMMLRSEYDFDANGDEFFDKHPEYLVK